VVTRAEFIDSGFTRAHLSGTRIVPYRMPSTLVTEVARLTLAGEAFVYAYYEGIDKVAHEYGLEDHYDAELRWVDRHLARLLAWIDQRFREEAFVVVVSDHGEELGEEGRVGHEFGLDQRLLHVPLFVRGPGVRPERNDQILTLRRLYDFLLHLGSGASPAFDLLTEPDEFGTLAERYPSKGTIRVADPRYRRPWVAEFAGRYKAVGPSSSGMEIIDIEASGFRDAPALHDSALAQPLRDRIDHYWEVYQDRRSRGGPETRPSEEELERLRSLGYIQ